MLKQRIYLRYTYVILFQCLKNVIGKNIYVLKTRFYHFLLKYFQKKILIKNTKIVSLKNDFINLYYIYIYIYKYQILKNTNYSTCHEFSLVPHKTLMCKISKYSRINNHLSPPPPPPKKTKRKKT